MEDRWRAAIDRQGGRLPTPNSPQTGDRGFESISLQRPVFQPAEETGEGAQAMIDDGLFDRFANPDVVLGQHVMVGPAGTIGGHAGVITSEGDSLQFRITRSRPGAKLSTPASAAEYTGPPPGGSPLARYRDGVISTHRPMGTPRARWCAPARSPPWFYGRACKTLLKGVSVARLTLWKPPAPITSRTRASPACAGRRTDLLRQRGRHADHHRTRVIKVGRPGSNGLRGGRLPSARRPSTRRPALAIVTFAAAPAGSPMSPMS